MSTDTATFVLVHGAWHGGWCWREVAAILRGAGHRVTTPTLTGLGERSHLLAPGIDLDLMVTDIINHLFFEDLGDVHLVGHSFGGPVISGVADRVPERLASLTYLDSIWLESGEAPADLVAPEVWAERAAEAEERYDGLALPVPSPEMFGVTDPEMTAWMTARLTPHPMASYTTPLHLDHPPTNGVPARYVVCTEPAYAPLAPHAERARAAGLETVDLAGPHDAMVTHPEATAGILLG